ncbi:MAG: hypothetical protein MHPSP_004426, partial [Paramarteilia canceri]
MPAIIAKKYRHFFDCGQENSLFDDQKFTTVEELIDHLDSLIFESKHESKSFSFDDSNSQRNYKSSVYDSEFDLERLICKHVARCIYLSGENFIKQLEKK